eukprot:4427720-Lingulodinium_polyedra.AAC.1
MHVLAICFVLLFWSTTKDHAEEVAKQQLHAETVKEVIKKLQVGTGGSKHTAKSSQAGSSSSSSSRRPPLPQTHLDEKGWQLCMPRGFRIYADVVNQRHQGYNRH